MYEGRFKLISNGGLYAVWDNVADKKASLWFATKPEADTVLLVMRQHLKDRQDHTEAEKIAAWVEQRANQHGHPVRAALLDIAVGIRRGDY